MICFCGVVFRCVCVNFGWVVGLDSYVVLQFVVSVVLISFRQIVFVDRNCFYFGIFGLLIGVEIIVIMMGELKVEWVFFIVVLLLFIVVICWFNSGVNWFSVVWFRMVKCYGFSLL